MVIADFENGETFGAWLKDETAFLNWWGSCNGCRRILEKEIYIRWSPESHWRCINCSKLEKRDISELVRRGYIW